MGRMDFDTMNEAFRAGNRARRKESVQDTVESVDNIQAQIDLFEEQTGKKLEIRDGRPYFDKYLKLIRCTKLTSLPTGLKVNGKLDLTGCTGLTSLPAGLEVGRDLWLTGCTGLTSLPTGLEIGGYLDLRGCTGLTSLPDGLKVGKNLYLNNCTGLTSLPAGLEVIGALVLGGCTGLTSLPDGLKVGESLFLKGCTGLTSLPFDLIVNPDYQIVHKNILTPFFRKLGIPVDIYGNTKAEDWYKWQKANGYLTEAFRAGNRARKKESVGDAAADMHNPLQDQIDRFKEQTGIELEIRDGRPYYKGNCMDFSGNADIPDNMFVESDFSVSIEQERLPAGLTVTGMLDLGDCKKLTELPPNITACDLKLTNSGIKKVPNDTNITGSFIIYGEDDQDLDRFFREDCGLRPLTVNAGSEYRPEFENRIIGFSWNRWRTVGKPDFDKIHNMLTANEAFRAGNRARKKESVQDAVESVDNIQAQIELFREQTGKELEIKDGHPYYDGNLNLSDCIKLTNLPVGLEINGYLSLTRCTGLTSLPDGLKVGGGLSLARCTGLTSLPDGLKVEGDLTLSGCTGLTSLPVGLKVGGHLLAGHTGLTSLPAGLEVEGDLYLEGCTGLISLPSDLVVQGNWITHGGILTPFFRKLRIGADKYGNTKALNWRKWQKAHGYLSEAFKAGNRARKKESVQDAVESVDSLEEQVREFEKVTGAKLEIRQGIPLGNWLNLKDCTELTRLPDGLTVFGNMNLAGCTGLKKLPDGLIVYGYLNLNRCTGLTSLPHGMYVTGSIRLSGCDGITELPADLKIEIKDIQSNSIYDVPDSLKPFLNRLGITTDIHGDITAEDWMERRHLIGKTDEAFRAGNRARKKEAVTDTVSIGLTPEQQIKLFMADVMKYREWLIQQGKTVEDDTVYSDENEEEEYPVGVYYNDGINDVFRIEGDKVVIRSIVDFADYPYEIHFPEKVQCNALVNLINCTGLTSLPDGMYVQDHLNLEGCSNLRRLPENLYVGYDLYLNGCTGLESLPSNFTVNYGDLDLEDCLNIKEIPTSANLVKGRIVFSPDSELHRFFIRNNIGYTTEGTNNPANPRKWHICDFSKWNAWNGMREAFKAGNRARKKEAARDTVEMLEDMNFPTVMRSPVNLISDLARFLYRLGYKVADERELRDPHHMQNDNPICYYSENFGNSSYGGNYIRISLGRHPVWNERLQRFISTGLILCIEATDRMYYRVQFLPADKEVEESVQFLNCSSKWFEAWEKPDGTRYGKPRNEAALTDNSIPAVWPNLFRNILTAARHPEYVFVPDKTYTKCWSFEKPSDIDEAFKAGNRARKQEAARDTVQTTGEYRPVTRELFKDVIDSIIDPEEGPISGRVYRRYDRSITGQCIVNCLNRILELCGYKDMLKAEVAFEDNTCDGVQITDDKNYSVSRMVIQYNRDYVCVLTGSMNTGMPGLLYAYRNLPGILEVHLEGIDTLNADLREYIDKFG